MTRPSQIHFVTWKLPQLGRCDFRQELLRVGGSGGSNLEGAAVSTSSRFVRRAVRQSGKRPPPSPAHRPRCDSVYVGRRCTLLEARPLSPVTEPPSQHGQVATRGKSWHSSTGTGLDWTGLDWMDGWIMDAGESGDAGSSPALELIDADDGGIHRKPESLDSVLPLCPWTGCEVCRLSE